MLTNYTWVNYVEFLKNVEFKNSELPFWGTLNITNSLVLDSLKECFSASDDTKISFHETYQDIQNVTVGETIEIDLFPRIGFGILAYDLTGLLKCQRAQISSINFFLVKDKIGNTDSQFSAEIQRYFSLLSFVSEIQKYADYIDENKNTLVFSKNGKISIPISYEEEDVNNLQQNDVALFQKEISQKNNDKCINGLLKEAVLEMTISSPEKERFKHILKNIPDLINRFNNNYNVYLSGFSFEKIKNELEIMKVEYAGKIHKVFSDIQNQILTIPVATVIVATQMKTSNDMGTEFLLNTTLLFGCWFFTVLIVFLLKNQFHTVSVINEEVLNQRKRIEKEYALIAPDFQTTFSFLNKRCKRQKNYLLIIFFFIVFGFVYSHFVFFKQTTPARNLLIKVITYISKHHENNVYFKHNII